MIILIFILLGWCICGWTTAYKYYKSRNMFKIDPFWSEEMVSLAYVMVFVMGALVGPFGILFLV